MRTRRRRLKRGAAGGAVTSAVLIGAFLVFVSLYTATKATRIPENARVEVACRRTVEVFSTLPAFVSAKEKVFVAPISGRLEKIVPEGTVVRVGVPVAQIVNDEAMARVEPDYAAAERELKSFSLNARVNLERARDQLMLLRVEKKRLEAAVAECERRGDRAGASGAKRSLKRVNEGIRELSSIIESQERAAREKAGMLAGRRDIEKEMMRLASSVLEADSPGLVSYELDGNEGIIDGPDMDALSSRLEKPGGEGGLALSDGQHVEAGSRVFKIIDTVEMRIALTAGGELMKGLKGRVWIRFPEFEPSRWPARVVNAPHKAGEPVILAVSAFVLGVNARRFVKVDVITEVSEDVAVPVDAVFSRGQDNYVYVIRSEDVVPRKVTVGPSDGKYMIIERGIPEGTRIVCNPWILEGQHGRYPAKP